MLLDDWMDELEDKAFFEYGREAYNSITMRPFLWEEMHAQGMTTDEALIVEFGE